MRDADIAVGGTTSSEVMTREAWLKPGAVFISLARREFEPDGWGKVDKVVIDSWEMNYLMPFFRQMVDGGTVLARQLHGEIHEVVAGTKPGRERADERILIHTTGLVTQDVAHLPLPLRAGQGQGHGHHASGGPRAGLTPTWMENAVLKIIDLQTAAAEPMEKGRGSKIKLVNTSLGTEALDVHLNRLVPGGARGSLHKHSQADNV